MINFRVVPDGGEPFDVTASSRDIFQWERTNKGASFQSLMADMRMTDLYKVAYIASRRQGKFTGTEQDFQQQCDLDTRDDDEGESDPTPPAPSPAP